MTITTNYETTQALMTDFHHVTALATRKGRVLAQRIFYTVFGLLGLGNGILLLLIFGEIDGNPASTLAIAVLGMLFGAYFLFRAVFYYPYLGFFRKYVMRRRLSGRVSEVRYTFDKAEMTIDDALEHCTHAYSAFCGIYESRRIFALLMTPRVGYIIAKTDLSEEQMQELRTLLQEHFEVPLIYYDV